MGILNNLFKFVEPAAGEIIKDVALSLFDIAGEVKNDVGPNYLLSL